MESTSKQERLVRLFIALLSVFPDYTSDWQFPYESAEERAQKFEDLCKQIKALIENNDAKSISSLFSTPEIPLPDLETALDKAEECQLGVNTEQDQIEVKGQISGYHLKLKLDMDDPSDLGTTVTFQMFSDARILMIEMTFWIPENCPAIVCRPFIHPRTRHKTIPWNRMLDLRNTIELFGDDSLWFQWSEANSFFLT